MVLSRLCFFINENNICSFQGVWKSPRLKWGVTVLNSYSSKCVRIAGWRFKVQYYFFQNVAINFYKNRHTPLSLSHTYTCTHTHTTHTHTHNTHTTQHTSLSHIHTYAHAHAHTHTSRHTHSLSRSRSRRAHTTRALALAHHSQHRSALSRARWSLLTHTHSSISL